MTKILKTAQPFAPDRPLLDASESPERAFGGRAHMRESDHRIKNHLQLIGSNN